MCLRNHTGIATILIPISVCLAPFLTLFALRTLPCFGWKYFSAGPEFPHQPHTQQFSETDRQVLCPSRLMPPVHVPCRLLQSASDTTGEYTCIMAAALEHPDVAGGAAWLAPLVTDFKAGGYVSLPLSLSDLAFRCSLVEQRLNMGAWNRTQLAWSDSQA